MNEQVLHSGAILRGLPMISVPSSTSNATADTTGVGNTWIRGKKRKKPFTISLASSDESEEEFEVLDEIISLIDLVSRKRIKIPGKFTLCQHAQAFDIPSFLALYQLQNDIEVPSLSHFNRYEPQNIYASVKRDGEFKLVFKNNEMKFKIAPKGNKLIVNTQKRKFIKKTNLNTATKKKQLKCPICGVKSFLFELVYDDFTQTILDISLNFDKYLLLANNEIKLLKTQTELEQRQSSLALNSQNESIVLESGKKNGPPIVINLSDEEVEENQGNETDEEEDDPELDRLFNEFLKEKSTRIMEDDVNNFSEIARGTSDDPVLLESDHE
ncbi:hypothetical protein WICMUC_005815 [Wickerhamomyces mucosus]|uniref:SP-RING-type domain-containing protein n=1 Tax=Wickerhamomyces mucosus TaxID=1378264 RepID=A0A9P8T3W3_9ASCO|nr:hypothetical protein WICMUC_005815 [Wickerhamomyces mucosus]